MTEGAFPMPTLTKAPSEEAIRVHAYHLWEQDGRPHGRDVEFWQKAIALIGAAKPTKAPAAKPKAAKATAVEAETAKAGRKAQAAKAVATKATAKGKAKASV